VVEVCRDLVQSSSLPPGTVAARDIGVIAAFRQQVLKLRLALRAAGLSNVSVGSVEDFQVTFSYYRVRAAGPPKGFYHMIGAA
jgi:hypothetical protein